MRAGERRACHGQNRNGGGSVLSRSCAQAALGSHPGLIRHSQGLGYDCAASSMLCACAGAPAAIYSCLPRQVCCCFSNPLQAGRYGPHAIPSSALRVASIGNIRALLPGYALLPRAAKATEGGRNKQAKAAAEAADMHAGLLVHGWDPDNPKVLKAVNIRECVCLRMLAHALVV